MFELFRGGRGNELDHPMRHTNKKIVVKYDDQWRDRREWRLSHKLLSPIVRYNDQVASSESQVSD